MNKIRPQKPFLMYMYGFPGAGKTYLARQLSEDIQVAHIQADRIRNELFTEPKYDRTEEDIINQLMNYMAEEFLKAGVSVIYDFNAIRNSQRRFLRELARNSKAESLLVWLQLDMETAYLRNYKRDKRKNDDKYSHSLNQTEFKDFISKMQNPSTLDNYMVVSGKHSYQTQKNSIINKLKSFGIISSEDINNHVTMPGMVNLIPNSYSNNNDLSKRNIVIR